MPFPDPYTPRVEKVGLSRSRGERYELDHETNAGLASEVS